jgi:hypothetical protein
VPAGIGPESRRCDSHVVARTRPKITCLVLVVSARIMRYFFNVPVTVDRNPRKGVNIHDNAKAAERRRKGSAMGLAGRAWRPAQRQGQALHDREDFTTFFDIKPFGIMKYPSYVAPQGSS